LLAAAMSVVAEPKAALAHDDPTERIDDLSIMLQHAPHDAHLLMRRGELYREVGRYADAEADLAAAERLSPRLEGLDFARGLLFLEAGQPARARVALDRVLARTPGLGEALLLRSRAWTALDHREVALSDMDQALATLPRLTPDVCIERARLVAADTTARSEALEGLDRAIGRFGPIVTLEDEAIGLELALGRPDSALARLDRIAAQLERKETVLLWRADVLAYAGRSDEAIDSYRLGLAAIAALPERQRTAGRIRELELRARNSLARLLASDARGVQP
jgi:tetratricopeptide (TPR) repeat protein